jgi:transposase-like protein
MLTVALEQEARHFVAQYADQKTAEGTQRVVRNGNLPERYVQTGIGNIAVSVPRVRDRTVDSAERITFSSAIVPPYLRRSKSLETLLPLLYLKGISTGDFQNALSPLLGEGAKNLSPNLLPIFINLLKKDINKNAKMNKNDFNQMIIGGMCQ